MNNLEGKVKELKREYHRKWARENKQKIKEYQERYWLKKAAEQLKNSTQSEAETVLTVEEK